MQKIVNCSSYIYAHCIYISNKKIEISVCKVLINAS